MDISRLRPALEKANKEAQENAAMGGRHHDEAASRALHQLEYFEDGIRFAMTGVTEKYGAYIKKLEQEEDPEYKEHLRLCAKFGKKV